MAIQLDTQESGEISIEDFVAEARRANLHDETELRDLAPAMHKLCNNKGFLEDFILGGLKDIQGFQQDNVYSAQSYILGEVSGRSFLRFAIWAPLDFNDQLDEKNFYSYERAHNHDFSLLTAGYLGPGYRTTINTLLEQPRGYIGEKVRLGPSQVIVLSPGRVLLYEAGRDVHVQHPPSALSVSLNLIVDQSDKFKEQLYFDLPMSRVAGYVGNVKLKRGSFLRFAAALGNERCRAVVEQVSRTHPCEVTRVYAYRSLALMAGGPYTKLLMARDPSDLVRRSVCLIEDGFAESRIWG